ncbi:hypothetical protein GGS21DRAFT_488460 [Xylaria nigripes]|nr:hypothetical protein GGS21DRAFT_488460 [Xylaria nigripes]
MATKTPRHLVHCQGTRKVIARWPQPPKPETKDGKEIRDDDERVLFHKLQLDKIPRGFDKYWEWLMQNPDKFQEFCEATEYFTKICPPFLEQQECCLRERRAEEDQQRRMEEEGDSEEEELEIVVPRTLGN